MRSRVHSAKKVAVQISGDNCVCKVRNDSRALCSADGKVRRSAFGQGPGVARRRSSISRMLRVMETRCPLSMNCAVLTVSRGLSSFTRVRWTMAERLTRRNLQGGNCRSSVDIVRAEHDCVCPRAGRRSFRQIRFNRFRRVRRTRCAFHCERERGSEARRGSRQSAHPCKAARISLAVTGFFMVSLVKLHASQGEMFWDKAAIFEMNPSFHPKFCDLTNDGDEGLNRWALQG